MKNKYTILLSFLVSILFFIGYFRIKETLYLVLGFAWLCISITRISREKKNKEEDEIKK